MLESDDSFQTMYEYKDLIEHDNLQFLTPDTLTKELSWAESAKGCLGCGKTQPDCELTWEVNGEALDYAQGLVEHDLRFLCRPRRWICAFDTEACAPRVLCPSCYQLVRFECVQGVWDADFMCPYRLQMLLPFGDAEPGAAL